MTLLHLNEQPSVKIIKRARVDLNYQDLEKKPYHFFANFLIS